MPAQRQNSETMTVSFVPSRSGDTIRDEQIAEVARRLIVRQASPSSGDIIYSESEPTDKSKRWQPVDNAGNLVGALRRWDSENQVWVVDFQIEPNSVISYTFERALSDGTIILEGLTFDRPSLKITPFTDPGASFRYWLDPETMTIHVAGIAADTECRIVVFDLNDDA